MSKYARYHANRRTRLLRRLGERCTQCGARENLEVAHLLGDGGEERSKRGSAGVVTQLLAMDSHELHAYVALMCQPCHRAHDLAAGHLAWKGELQNA